MDVGLVALFTAPPVLAAAYAWGTAIRTRRFVEQDTTSKPVLRESSSRSNASPPVPSDGHRPLQHEDERSNKSLRDDDAQLLADENSIDRLSPSTYAGAGSLAVSTMPSNTHIQARRAPDARQVVSTELNVLDGGLGFNFMAGGSDTETFFTDARAPGVVSTTIRNFEAGDSATLWGFNSGVSSYHWEEVVAGAAGM